MLGGNNEAANLPQKRFAALLQRRLAMCSIGVFTLYMSLGEYCVCLVQYRETTTFRAIVCEMYSFCVFFT